MSMALALTLAIGSQASFQAVDAAFPEMRDNRYSDAIEKIAEGQGDSAAQHINLGVAYAHAGETEKAREMFRRALASDAVMLETASGEWRDSRRMAWQMLAMLDNGKLSPVRTAAR